MNADPVDNKAYRGDRNGRGDSLPLFARRRLNGLRRYEQSWALPVFSQRVQLGRRWSQASLEWRQASQAGCLELALRLAFALAAVLMPAVGMEFISSALLASLSDTVSRCRCSSFGEEYEFGEKR